MKGHWVKSDLADEGEILYFFHPADGGGGQAYIAMKNDGTVEFSGDRKLVIKKVGSGKERMFIQNAADLVI